MREIKSRNDVELLVSSYSTSMYFIYLEITFKFPKYSNFCKLLQIILKWSKGEINNFVLLFSNSANPVSIVSLISINILY